jgi:hypothetical protein
MTQYIIKVLLSALIVVAVSETAKRSTFWGGILASLPLVSLVAMTWLWYETKDAQKVGQFSWSVFWLVIPSLVLFAILPLLLKRGVGFWPALLSAIVGTCACYFLMVWLLRRIGVTAVG